MAYATVEQLLAYLDQLRDKKPSGPTEAELATLAQVLDGASSILDVALAPVEFAPWPAAFTKRLVACGGILSLPPHQAGSVSATVPVGWQLYDVTAVWGYGPAPAAVVEICLQLAVNMWRSKDSGGYSEVGGAEGGGQIRYVAGMTRAQSEVIDAVKNALIPQAV